LSRTRGNMNVGINVSSNATADQLIGGNNPKFRFWGQENESGSCLSGIQTSALDLSGTSQTLCGSLAYPDANDAVWCFIELFVPSDAHPGAHTASLTITSTPA